MRSFAERYLAVAASLVAAARALDGIVAPDSVAADSEFQVTFQNPGSDQYRVFLAAALAGVNGPTCYLKNSTSLSSPVSLTIPSSVGPSADYYSIAIADLTTSQPSTFSNRFNFTGGTGNYTEYESHLGGAPFWDANDLPCSSYACARQCAQAGYPNDLSDNSAYDTMRQCILKCPGVSPAVSQTRPAHATATGSGQAVTMTANEAVITLGPNQVLTAIETTATSDGKAVTEAIIGSETITLGAKATVSGKPLSLLGNGVAIDGTTTVAFSSAVQTLTTSVQDNSASATSASPAATSSGAANRADKAVAGVVGIAGLAAMLL